jgi:imidazole glycerol phosphate synthase subunit hisF (EC 4.1.3.-)
MDRDGTKEGYEINLTSRVVKSVRIPVIASGGAKDAKDMEEVFVKADASAALAASIFHYGETGIKDVKKYLKSKGLHVRL